MTKVSVITPCYNAERFLKQSIDSILGQTLKEIELICIDDGSKDNTLDILREYEKKDSRVRVLTQPNLFAGVARNNGMAVAKGKYLSFLDADDFFEPTMLEKMYARSEQDSSDICICAGGTYDIASERIFLGDLFIRRHLLPKKLPFGSRDVSRNIFNLCTPAPWNKLYNAAFVKENGLRYQSIKGTDDIFFTITAMAIARKITVVDQWLVNYRVGSSSSQMEFRDDHFFSFYEARREIKEFLVDKGMYGYVEESFMRYCFSGGLFALSMCKTKDAWLRTALFLKKKYIPEFGLWDLRECRDNGQMAFIVKSSDGKLAKHDPVLRKDETAVVEKDPVFDFTLESGSVKVSVIIPFFNSEKYIEECVQSVLRQTLSDIEVICVDGGSTDKSVEIVSGIADEDSRVRLIGVKAYSGDVQAGSEEVKADAGEIKTDVGNVVKNGKAVARNRGLSVAQGEYIMFVDSDDLLVWCSLEHLYRKAKYHKLDDVFCEMQRFFDPVELYHENRNLYMDECFFKGIYDKEKSGQEIFEQMVRENDFRFNINYRLFRRDFLNENNIKFNEGCIVESIANDGDVSGRSIEERRIGERGIVERKIGERGIGERSIEERRIGERGIVKRKVGERRIRETCIHEEVLFTFQTLRLAKRVLVLKEPLYLKRIHKDSLAMTTSKIGHVNGYYSSLLEIEKIKLKENEIDDSKNEIDDSKNEIDDSKIENFDFIYEYKKQILTSMNCSITDYEWLNSSLHNTVALSLLIKMERKHEWLKDVENRRKIELQRIKNELNKIKQSRSWKFARLVRTCLISFRH